MKDYVGRESPLYYAKRLSESYRREDGSMPHIYLKREDLNHGCTQDQQLVEALLYANGQEANESSLRRAQVSTGRNGDRVRSIWP
jgi:tryptophan synthase beta subunit